MSQTILRSPFRPVALCALLAIAALLASAPAASAQSGGVSAGKRDQNYGPPGRAKLLKNGRAVPPSNAPRRVRKAIKAANKIRKRPYKYGGGHASFRSWGYDCSGAVSYVLRGAGMLKSPLPSGPLARWGRSGRGKWITVYANKGHAYVEVAGLRFDTSSAGDSASNGKGPRWRKVLRSNKGYKKRHWTGY